MYRSALYAIGAGLLLAGLALLPSAPARIPVLGVGKYPAIATYAGPGDVISGATAWYSCARAYNAAYAAAEGNLCDLVAVTGGAAVCTLKVATTGFANLSDSYCAGTTPAAACAAASGGSCKVTKAYDQTGNSNDAAQATLSAMPALTFSSSPTGTLPVMTWSGVTILSSSNNITQAQPFNMSAVYVRTSGTSLCAVIGSSASAVCIGGGTSANTAALAAVTEQAGAASDSSWLSLQGTFDGASSARNINGTDATGLNPGSTGLSATTLRVGRNTSGGNHNGSIAEAGWWPTAAWNATQRGDMNTNQHGTSGYNF